MKNFFGKIIKVVRKIFLPGALGLLVVLTISHFVWKYSGSNEWELVKDENDLKLYTLKTPGSTLLKIKTVMNVKTSLSSVVFLLRGDLSTTEDFVGEDFTIIEQIETPSLYMAYYSFNQAMPPPLGTKEIVMLLNYSQDKESKEVEISAQAASGRIPPTENVSRVKHLNNIFRLTPLPNGEVEWVSIMDVDIGIPYFIFNLAMPDYVHKDMQYTRELVMTEKYQKAKLKSIVEL